MICRIGVISLVLVVYIGMPVDCNAVQTSFAAGAGLGRHGLRAEAGLRVWDRWLVRGAREGLVDSRQPVTAVSIGVLIPRASAEAVVGFGVGVGRTRCSLGLRNADCPLGQDGRLTIGPMASTELAVADGSPWRLSLEFRYWWTPEDDALARSLRHVDFSFSILYAFPKDYGD